MVFVVSAYPYPSIVSDAETYRMTVDWGTGKSLMFRLDVSVVDSDPSEPSDWSVEGFLHLIKDDKFIPVKDEVLHTVLFAMGSVTLRHGKSGMGLSGALYVPALTHEAKADPSLCNMLERLLPSSARTSPPAKMRAVSKKPRRAVKRPKQRNRSAAKKK